MLGLPVVALWWLLTSIVVLVTSKQSTVTGNSLPQFDIDR